MIAKLLGKLYSEQPKENTLDYTGQLLIARPLNKDRYFKRSVVLVYESNRAGTVGVVLNKRSHYTVQTMCAQHDLVYMGKEYCYQGGPVNDRALILVHSNEWYCENTLRVNEYFSVTSHKDMFKRLSMGNTPRKWRLCAGLAAWSDDQLEGEMQGLEPWTTEHSWLTANPNPNIIWDYDGDEQWNRAVELSGKQLMNMWF